MDSDHDLHSVAQEIAKSKGDNTVGRPVVFLLSLVSVIIRLKVQFARVFLLFKDQNYKNSIFFSLLLGETSRCDLIT